MSLFFRAYQDAVYETRDKVNEAKKAYEKGDIDKDQRDKLTESARSQLKETLKELKQEWEKNWGDFYNEAYERGDINAVELAAANAIGKDVSDFNFGTNSRLDSLRIGQEFGARFAEGATLGILLGAKTGGSGGSSSWKFGQHKNPGKWQRQMEQRGWTPEQINQAMAKGKKFPAQNNVNKGNSATRYEHPETGRSVVVDDVTNEVIQVGGDGFKY